MTINKKMLELGFIWNVITIPVNKPEAGSRQVTSLFHSVLTILTFHCLWTVIHKSHSIVNMYYKQHHTFPRGSVSSHWKSF